MRWSGPAVTFGAGLLACRIATVDPAGHPCPCGDGLRCDPATNLCTRADAGVLIDTPMIDSPRDARALPPHFLFHLDEGSGTVAHDASGVGGDGSAGSGTTWLPAGGKLGGALHLDSSAASSNMSFPTGCTTEPMWTSSFTIALWAKFDALHPSGTYDTMGDFAAVQGSSGGTQGGWGIGSTDKCTGSGSYRAAIEVASGSAGSTRTIDCGTTALAPGTWYHLIGAYDAAAARLAIYVNGVLEPGSLVGTVPAAAFVPPSCPRLGGPLNNPPAGITGSVDEVEIFDLAVTDAEAARIFQAAGG